MHGLCLHYSSETNVTILWSCKFLVVSVHMLKVVCFSLAAPKVQVYSRTPGEFGKANILICHVSGFYPPEITIKLLKNGQEIPGASQTDLAFEENWHYHLTKHVPFTPVSGERFACKVTHMKNPVDYSWGMYAVPFVKHCSDH